MEKLARDFMTSEPACCRPHTMLDQVAKMMVQYDCGEIPVLDVTDRPIGVVTDRDIVCRVVAEEKNPMAYPAETCMSESVVTVRLTRLSEK
jgi:CBS domain-containing protein